MNIDVTARKEELRRIAYPLRAGVTPLRADQAGRVLTERLTDGSAYRAAHCLGVYLSVAGEIVTEHLINQARADGKTLCLSAWLPDRRVYDWVEFKADERIGRGPFGIPQPDLLRPLLAPPVDLVVVPGLGFDAGGGRVGHGKGIYDRLLIRPLLRHAHKVGWAFDFQMWEQIPLTEQDVRLDEVMTETPGYRAPRASALPAEDGT